MDPEIVEMPDRAGLGYAQKKEEVPVGRLSLKRQVLDELDRMDQLLSEANESNNVDLGLLMARFNTLRILLKRELFGEKFD